MDKEVLASVWAIPEEKEEESLSQIIRDLAQKYGAEVFVPHITIAGAIIADLEDLQNAIVEATDDINPFVVETKKLDQSKLWSKTLFIQMRTNEILDLILERIKRRIPNDYVLNPHMSLVYQEQMTKPQKGKEIRRISIPKSITINRVGIIYAANPTSTQEQVPSWQMPFVKRLGVKS